MVDDDILIVLTLIFLRFTYKIIKLQKHILFFPSVLHVEHKLLLVPSTIAFPELSLSIKNSLEVM